MSDAERELLKQGLEGNLDYEEPSPPPLAEAPDMADTLRLLERVSRMPTIRFDKVQRMRELIAQGRLETPERLEGTINRLMEELGL